jgi:hypothetical protein
LMKALAAKWASVSKTLTFPGAIEPLLKSSTFRERSRVQSRGNSRKVCCLMSGRVKVASPPYGQRKYDCMDSKVHQLDLLNSVAGQFSKDIAGLNVCKLRSLIVPQLPPLFEHFRAKCFSLLWRDSRDGFTAWEFHCHCDGRANTLACGRTCTGTFLTGLRRWSERATMAPGATIVCGVTSSH